jgi:hypothetical protein
VRKHASALAIFLVLLMVLPLAAQRPATRICGPFYVLRVEIPNIPFLALPGSLCPRYAD